MSEQGTTLVVRVAAQPVVTFHRDARPIIATQATNRAQMVRVGFAGAQGIPGPMGPTGTSTPITAIAATALTYPCIVAIVNGVAHYADPTSPTDMSSQLAVTSQAAAAGAAVACATQLTITEPAWAWQPGRIYLALEPGQLTQSLGATGAVLEVGRAVSPTTIEFNIQTAILR